MLKKNTNWYNQELQIEGLGAKCLWLVLFNSEHVSKDPHYLLQIRLTISEVPIHPIDLYIPLKFN